VVINQSMNIIIAVTCCRHKKNIFR